MIKKKIQFVLKNPFIIFKLLKLRKELSKNKKKGINNFIFQCDASGHFPYLEPYYNILKNEKNVDIYFASNTNNQEIISHLLYCGIPQKKIINKIELVKHTKWDVYISPTSWGNIFPKNKTCERIQIFHALADKNIHYGKHLIKFNNIFVCGPIHQTFLEKYLFEPYPESKIICKTHKVGFAKIDDLFKTSNSLNALKRNLKISVTDPRKIILYAPNWERTSALYKYGKEVFEILKDTDHIILIKLHYMSLLNSEIEGYDWNVILEGLENYENVKVIYDKSINQYLKMADILITDYGGAALEYMCTQKPIIYLDCPEFFEMRGKNILEYWSRDTGYIVSKVEDLPVTINNAFKDVGEKRQMQKKLVERLLYNPGKAAHEGKKVILENILGVGS